jgi:hypothetical protein
MTGFAGLIWRRIHSGSAKSPSRQGEFGGERDDAEFDRSAGKRAVSRASKWQQVARLLSFVRYASYGFTPRFECPGIAYTAPIDLVLSAIGMRIAY